MAPTRITFGEYQVGITIDGAEVEHYEVEVHEDTKTATCWIASTVGKRFAIHASKTHTKFDCAFSTYIDSPKFTGGKFLYKSETKSVTYEGITIGPQTIRPFLFGSLEVTDDDALLNGTASSENIGDIKIVIQRVSNLQPVRASMSAEASRVPECGKVHERSKKAIAHRVQYGIAESTKATTSQSCTYHELVACFIVRYRSLDLLKANGIVPRDASPDPPGIQDGSQPNPIAASNAGKRKLPKVKEEDIVYEIDSDDEEDGRKEAELEAELERLRKARLARQQKPLKKKVKTESKPVFLPGEVIDLTI